MQGSISGHTIKILLEACSNCLFYNDMFKTALILPVSQRHNYMRPQRKVTVLGIRSRGTTFFLKFRKITIKPFIRYQRKTTSLKFPEMDITNEMVGLGLSLLFVGGISIGFVASFTLHLLSLHPEYQERIREEVEEVMKKHNTTEFTYEVVRDLNFIDQCLRGEFEEL